MMMENIPMKAERNFIFKKLIGRFTSIAPSARQSDSGVSLYKVGAMAFAVVVSMSQAFAQLLPVVPPDKRGDSQYERLGHHDANNIRTRFWSYGMVGDYPRDPIGVDLSSFHSCEVPKGSGINYSDGITPFVLAQIFQGPNNTDTAWIMETGYRERQGRSPRFPRDMRFEPRPGYFQADAAINKGRAPALSNDPRTWPDTWPDKDASWDGQWNGYFGKRPAADQESFTVMDDDYYDAWRYYPDRRDTTRRGLGLRVEVRGFQWANPQAGNTIFWHYDITNEGTTDYPAPGQPENIIFGLYMDSGVGGSAIGCDPVPESDDDNAFFDTTFGLNLVYTWDNYGRGRGLNRNCATTGYLGYAYLETPGKPGDLRDNDRDGIVDEKRDSGPGQLITGQPAIEAYVRARYNMHLFEATYGPLSARPAVRVGKWWTGDEDMDWTDEFNDLGADGVPNTNDPGEGDGRPTSGETNFDKTDVHESDQIGLTGFKFNRINDPQGGGQTDNIVFFTDDKKWPQRLFQKFSHPDPAVRFDPPLVLNYNIGFLFASGPFTLKAGQTERFSLALAYGGNLEELRNTVKVVQAIYNANYQFAVPPPAPTLTAEAGDGYVQLYWDDIAERSVDPVTFQNDFEGYRIYRSTDPDFRDVRVILTGRGTNTIGNGKPIAQFDLKNGRSGFSDVTVEGVAYYLGSETGITHSWRDTTVTNGQQYYYAVTAYDYGASIPLVQGGEFKYYPSENAINVSRTLRGGTILPKNVVSVRPNPKALGYTAAQASQVTRIAGNGEGTVQLKVLNSALVPDNHVFKISFNTLPDSVHPVSYNLIDSTANEILFTSGADWNAAGTGPAGKGILPLIATPSTVAVDTVRSGFAAGKRTNADLKITYARSATMPINQRREGFPHDLTITFSDRYIDTVITTFGGFLPVKFRVTAQTPSGPKRLNCFFVDSNSDSTLSASGSTEEITVLTGPDSLLYVDRYTWSIKLKVNADSIRTPSTGDVYNLRLVYPFGANDAFVFRSKGEAISSDAARKQFRGSPYVVPNPYVGAASFEPEPYGVQGRGDRRIEFRGLPQNCTIRIYTVRGELVQTLRHDGTTEGYVPWDLRTKDNLDVAPGLYIYHVDAGSFGSHVDKFAIIK